MRTPNSPQITHRQDIKINSGQKLHKKQVPTQQTHDKEARATDLQQRQAEPKPALGVPPKGGRKAAERGHQDQKDAEEDQVRSDRAHQVDQAQHAHETKEEGEARLENRTLGTTSAGFAGKGIGGESIELLRQGRAVGAPESRERGEDDETEGVSQYEFKEAPKKHEDDAED